VRPLARGGGHPSGTAVAGSLVRSTREPRAGRPRTLAQGTVVPLLDLAPGGVYQAAAVTCGAGGLLHHRFTLTPAHAGAVCFLWHCPAGHPGSALPTTLPCGARTFLAGLAPGATARPTHPCSGYAERRRAGVDDRTPAGEARDPGSGQLPLPSHGWRAGTGAMGRCAGWIRISVTSRRSGQGPGRRAGCGGARTGMNRAFHLSAPPCAARRELRLSCLLADPGPRKAASGGSDAWCGSLRRTSQRVIF
jgi:hypothetical protein